MKLLGRQLINSKFYEQVIYLTQEKMIGSFLNEDKEIRQYYIPKKDFKTVATITKKMQLPNQAAATFPVS